MKYREIRSRVCKWLVKERLTGKSVAGCQVEDPDDVLYEQASSRASPLPQWTIAHTNSALTAKPVGAGLPAMRFSQAIKKRGRSRAFHSPQSLTALCCPGLPPEPALQPVSPLASSPAQPFSPQAWPGPFSPRFSLQASSPQAWLALSSPVRLSPERRVSALPPELAQVPESVQALAPLELELEPAQAPSQVLASSRRPNRQTGC